MNYKELESTFNAVAAAHVTPPCGHLEATTHHDGFGVVNLQCDACGFCGIANIETAIYLGWIKEDSVVRTSAV
jgi:hypothetical protein